MHDSTTPSPKIQTTVKANFRMKLREKWICLKLSEAEIFAIFSKQVLTAVTVTVRDDVWRCTDDDDDGDVVVDDDDAA